MTAPFILDYLVLVFVASSGVLQIAAACNDLRGLLFVRHRAAAILLGLALIAGAFAWFFISEPRNMADSGRGLNGNQQFGYFSAAAGAGLAFTLVVSSLRNWALGTGRRAFPLGLEALRESNYLRALYCTWQSLCSAVSRQLSAISKQR